MAVGSERAWSVNSFVVVFPMPVCVFVGLLWPAAEAVFGAKNHAGCL